MNKCLRPVLFCHYYYEKSDKQTEYFRSFFINLRFKSFFADDKKNIKGLET